MGALKPLVTASMIDGILFFNSESGKALLQKGFMKAGLSRCTEPDFIREVLNWSKTADADLEPVFTPAEELPPNATNYDLDYLAYVMENLEEELREGLLAEQSDEVDEEEELGDEFA